MQTIELDHPITFTDGDEIPSSVTFTPSANWQGTADDFLVTIKRGPKQDDGLHVGIGPMFQVFGVKVDPQHRCRGVRMDFVLAANFFGLAIVRPLGVGLAMSRVKEVNFYGLEVSAGKATETDQSVVDLGWPLESQTPDSHYDGCNQLRFYGGRVNYHDHRTYLSLRGQKNTSIIRMVTFDGFQFHEPPSFGFEGMHPEAVLRDDNRKLVVANGRARDVLFWRCNFTYHVGSPFVGRTFELERCRTHWIQGTEEDE